MAEQIEGGLSNNRILLEKIKVLKQQIENTKTKLQQYLETSQKRAQEKMMQPKEYYHGEIEAYTTAINLLK